MHYDSWLCIAHMPWSYDLGIWAFLFPGRVDEVLVDVKALHSECKRDLLELEMPDYLFFLIGQLFTSSSGLCIPIQSSAVDVLLRPKRKKR